MSRVLLAVALLLAACHRPENRPRETAAAAPGPVVKYRGSAVSANGLHLDLSIAADGGYTIFFMDPSGDDLPAAQLKDVAVDRVAFNINDTGETWVAKGTIPATADAKIPVSFSFRGKPDSATISLNAVNAPLDYVCPMDPDVRSAAPGNCPRCGMKLVTGIPDPEEWPLNLEVSPARPRAGEKALLTFSVDDPVKKKPVEKFEIVHERLFHLFIVSSDLKYFVHEHPAFQAGKFRYTAVFPKSGMYRILGDFYPSGGTPQLAPKTIFVGGGPLSLEETKLTPDLGTQKGRTTAVDLQLDPPHPAAGAATHLIFTLKPADGLEKYLGAWAHMLAASDDVIDLLHEHPYDAQNGKIEFDMTFPRARTYRVWIQFQRQGAVNTVAFNVPVQQAQP